MLKAKGWRKEKRQLEKIGLRPARNRILPLSRFPLRGQTGGTPPPLRYGSGTAPAQTKRYGVLGW